MRSSISQVAALAKVSSMTVSHALKGRKHAMSAATYERVLEAARELNYIPVRTASQNRHIETRAIGVVPFHAVMTDNILDHLTNGGICEGARRHGYDVLIMLRDEADWMVNRQDVRFLDRRSDGFIFLSGGMGEWKNALDLLVENKIPTVVCYRRDVPPEVAWVDPDNEGIVRQLLECFARHGHRRIAYLAAPEVIPETAIKDPNVLVSAGGVHSNHDDVQRRATFLAAMAEGTGKFDHHVVLTGATPFWAVHPDVIPTLVREGITGVICANDFLALRFLEAARTAGIAVPEQLSVAGIDDLAQAEGSGLTSVSWGYAEVGRRAVDSWLRLHSGAAPQDCCQTVPAQLVERTSVTAPRRQLELNLKVRPNL